MGRKRKGLKINGWVNLDKPEGLTSTQALGRVRRALKAAKAGHAGTLDPLATGVLPIALGEATKTIPYVQDALKTYTFIVTWGEQRDTDDSQGACIKTSPHRPAAADIDNILQRYTGDIMQVPPQYSALKIEGKRAYDLARAGAHVELKARSVYVEALRLTEAHEHSASFSVRCGKGTYVRALARDMAADLGTCGYISALRRTHVGPFNPENLISLDILENLEHSAALNQAVLPLETALDDIPALPVAKDEAARLRNGNALTFVSRPDFERLKNAGLGAGNDETAVARQGETAVAIVSVRHAHVQPMKVFNVT